MHWRFPGLSEVATKTLYINNVLFARVGIMSNTNKNAVNISGSAGKASNFLPYVAAAIVVIVIALAVFMAPQAQAPANPGTQPSATQGDAQWI